MNNLINIIRVLILFTLNASALYMMHTNNTQYSIIMTISAIIMFLSVLLSTGISVIFVRSLKKEVTADLTKAQLDYYNTLIQGKINFDLVPMNIIYMCTAATCFYFNMIITGTIICLMILFSEYTVYNIRKFIRYFDAMRQF